MESTAISKKQTHNRQVNLCKHCDATCGENNFCCSGCEAAYATINNIKGSANNIETIFSPFANSNDDGSNHITYSVNGIHCASCIQLIENALYGQKDITSARVNMSTGRLVVEWTGKKERADAFGKIVSNLGYKVKPFNESGGKKSSNNEESFLLRCLAIAGFAMGNLMMISVGLWATDGETMGMATQEFFYLISALIGLPAIVYSGRPFFLFCLFGVKKRAYQYGCAYIHRCNFSKPDEHIRSS
jgi:Cu2+-exporting ATPase